MNQVLVQIVYYVLSPLQTRCNGSDNRAGNGSGADGNAHPRKKKGKKGKKGGKGKKGR
jgi:hypothetical protein